MNHAKPMPDHAQFFFLFSHAMLSAPVWTLIPILASSTKLSQVLTWSKYSWLSATLFRLYSSASSAAAGQHFGSHASFQAIAAIS